VPQDLAIAGFDNDEAARYAVTPVSTIDNDVDELAERSVARLMRLVEAGPVLPEAETELLHGRLIVRESTDAAAAGEP
jgi:DNA-binding LacI/PurR family transcriptional regulator